MPRRSGPAARVAYVLVPDADARAAAERHAIGRQLLRRAAAAALGVSVGSVSVDAEDSGRPIVVEPAFPTFVSLAHSGRYVAAAAATSRVGIDLEQLPRSPGHPGLLPRICSSAELARLEALDPTARDRQFITIWTRKEAYGKALGVGLSYDLRAVTAGPTESKIQGVDGDWFVTDLDLGPDVAASLVLEGGRVHIDVESVAYSTLLPVRPALG